MESREHTSRYVALVMAVVALTAVAVPARSQESVKIGGTSVSLAVPPGFSPKGRGLDNGAGSTITVSERSAQSYAEMAELFGSAKSLSAAYAEQGITIRAVRQIATPTGQALFASGTQNFRGKNSIRYFALLKGDKTVLVTFSLADRSFSEADAEALVRSVELAPAPTLEEQLAGVPFTFDVVEPFRVTNIVERNTVTLGVGEDNAAASTRPVIIIGRGQSQALMGDEPRVAVDLLKRTGGWREAAITMQGPATFAGGPGYVITAVIEDRTAIQYLRIVPGGAYLRLLARGPTTAVQAAEAAITEIANSVQTN